MRSTLVVVLCLIGWAPFAVGAARAEPASAPYVLQLDFTPAAPTVGDVPIRARVTHDGAPASGVQIAVEADMPAMPAMRSSRAILTSTSDGVYEGSIALSMAGSWRFRLTARGPAGSSEISLLKPVTDAAPTPTPGPTPAGEGSSARISVRTAAPLHVGTNVLYIDVQDASGQPLEGIDVWTGLTMPGMFMHVPPRKAQRSPSNGGSAEGKGGPSSRFERRVRLPMAGQWALTVDVEQGAGRQGDVNGRLPTVRLARHTATLTVAGPSPVSSLAPAAGLALFGGLVTLIALRRTPRRARAATLLGCVLCIAAALAVGEALRAHQARDDSMGMEMDMAAPDMGLSAADLAAPIPVLVEQVKRGAVIAYANGTATVAPTRDPAQAHLVARISVRDRARLQNAGEVVIAPQDGQAPMLGRRVSAADQVDPATQTVEVEAVVPDPTTRLRPGQQVPVRIEVERREHIVAIPPSALVTDLGHPAVWRIHDIAGQRVARRQFVQPGLASADQVEIVTGLVAGDEIATWGLDSLQDGSTVSPASRGGGPYHNLLLEASPSP